VKRIPPQVTYVRGLDPKLLSMSSNQVYTDTSITNKIAKSENVLHTVMNKCDITGDGQNFVDMVIDPAKDLGGIRCAGFPDASNRQVNFHHIQKSVTVSAPSGLLPTETWDCHAFQGPIASNHNIIDTNQIRANFLQQRRGFKRQIGGLNILTRRTVNASLPLGYINQAANLAVESTFFEKSNSRVVYQAHEGRNVTPDLYRSGTVLVYRKTEMPLAETTFTATVWNPAATPTPTGYGSLSFKNLDTDVGIYSDLLQLPGSKQWKASEGHYCVGTMSSMNQPVGTDKAEPILILDTDLQNATGDQTEKWMSETFPYVPIPNVDIEFLGNDPVTNVSNQPFITNFNTSGAYYTGLSPQTVLVFTAIYGIEEAPDTMDTKLTSLAHISPSYDPCAIELASKLAHVMPAGVPVTDNGSGDYLAMMADLAAMVGIPGSNFLQKGAKPLGGLIDGWIGLQTKNPWTKPTNPRQAKNVNSKINTNSKNVPLMLELPGWKPKRKQSQRKNNQNASKKKQNNNQKKRQPNRRKM
jgi:hypothetical protein